MRSLNVWCVIAAAAAEVIASGVPLNIPLRYRTVIELPGDVWIENLAVRANGNILLTTLAPNASLYEVLDPAGRSPSLVRHFTLDQISSLLGIAELTPDRFVIAGGNFSFTKGAGRESFGLWSIDFNDSSPQPSFLAGLPGAGLLNGVTVAPETEGVVLIADSFLNVVWRVNAGTQEVDVAADLHQITDPPAGSALGINGIKIHGEDLWWTNSTAGIDTATKQSELALYRIKVGKDGSPASGAQPEKFVDFDTPALDDFTFGPGDQDTKWVATNSGNSIYAVNTQGRKAVVAGGSDSRGFATTTSCQFGRTQRDSEILYVTTSGIDKTGASQEGVSAKVQAIDATGLYF